MLLSEKIRNIATPGDLFPELSAAEKRTDHILADIAVKIRGKRKAMQMSQKEFAEFLGVSQSMVSKWEGAEYNFSIEKLVDLFTRLDIPIDIHEKTPNNSIKAYEKHMPLDWNTNIKNKRKNSVCGAA